MTEAEFEARAREADTKADVDRLVADAFEQNGWAGQMCLTWIGLIRAGDDPAVTVD